MELYFDFVDLYGLVYFKGLFIVIFLIIFVVYDNFTTLSEDNPILDYLLFKRSFYLFFLSISLSFFSWISYCYCLKFSKVPIILCSSIFSFESLYFARIFLNFVSGFEGVKNKFNLLSSYSK